MASIPVQPRPKPEYRPYLWKKQLSASEVDLIFFAYKTWTYKERPLFSEELLEVIIIALEKDHALRFRDWQKLLNVFDDPQDTLTQKHHKRTLKNTHKLQQTVDRAFGKRLSEHREARETASMLEGIKARVEIPEIFHTQWANGHVIEVYQFIPLYVIANWCRSQVLDMNPIPNRSLHLTAQICVFHNVEGSSEVMADLANSKHPSAQIMAGFIAPHKEIFAKNTQKLLNEHIQDLRQHALGSLFIMHPPSDPDLGVTTATTGMERMTLGATSDPSQSPYTSLDPYRPQQPMTDEDFLRLATQPHNVRQRGPSLASNTHEARSQAQAHPTFHEDNQLGTGGDSGQVRRQGGDEKRKGRPSPQTQSASSKRRDTRGPPSRTADESSRPARNPRSLPQSQLEPRGAGSGYVPPDPRVQLPPPSRRLTQPQQPSQSQVDDRPSRPPPPPNTGAPHRDRPFDPVRDSSSR